MGNVIHRTTLEYRASVSTPEFADPPWLANPDMTGVAGVPTQYLKLVGDVPTEMTSGEKAAVDAAALIVRRAAAVAQLQQTEDVLRALMLTVLDELNAHSAKTVQLLDAIDAAASLAELKTAVAAITDLTQQTESQLRTAIKAKLGT